MQKDRGAAKPNVNFDLELGMAIFAITLFVIVTYAGRYDLSMLF